jgi:hypothetical protein
MKENNRQYRSKKEEERKGERERKIIVAMKSADLC